MNITLSYASAAYAVQTIQAVSSTRAASASETTAALRHRLEAMHEANNKVALDARAQFNHYEKNILEHKCRRRCLP